MANQIPHEVRLSGHPLLPNHLDLFVFNALIFDKGKFVTLKREIASIYNES